MNPSKAGSVYIPMDDIQDALGHVCIDKDSSSTNLSPTIYFIWIECEILIFFSIQS
jgi:hypothetical protein